MQNSVIIDSLVADVGSSCCGAVRAVPVKPPQRWALVWAAGPAGPGSAADPPGPGAAPGRAEGMMTSAVMSLLWSHKGTMTSAVMSSLRSRRRWLGESGAVRCRSLRWDWSECYSEGGTSILFY